MSLESQSKEICLICTEKYTKSIRKKVICPNRDCRSEVCVTCFKTYMKSTLNDPHCMQCKFGWTYEFLGNFLTKTYLSGEYKKNREKILIDREMNLLPQSQEAAERIIKQRVIDEKINVIFCEKRVLDHELNLKMPPSGRYGCSIKRVLNVCKGNMELLTRIVDYENEIEHISGVTQSCSEEKKERRVFVKPCPADDCRGFLSTQWKCGICEVQVCSKCHEIIDGNIKTEHTCDPDSVKTAEMLKKDSKGCPKCGVMIFKIHGCDQMWCTSCNTAFSWNTLKILANNRVHNPHYFEYMQRMDNGEIARDPLDIQCGGLPDANIANRILNKLLKRGAVDKFSGKNIMNFLRIAIHIEQEEIAITYRVREDNSNDDLRVKYLLKETTKDVMKKTICKRETKNNHNQMISQVLNMFVNVANDIIQRILSKVTENNIISKL